MPLPKSACKPEEEKFAIIFLLSESTGEAEMSLFHGLSFGNTGMYSASASVAVQVSEFFRCR